ncbi:MAG: diphosphomevalonate decarboxylase, partial [Psychroflexus halocasei]
MQKPEFVCHKKARYLLGQSFSASAPSNIALVKYWGKYGEQLPTNTSISFTLNACKTDTKLVFKSENKSNDFVFDVFFEGEKSENFKPKIK